MLWNVLPRGVGLTRSRAKINKVLEYLQDWLFSRAWILSYFLGDFIITCIQYPSVFCLLWQQPEVSLVVDNWVTHPHKGVMDSLRWRTYENTGRAEKTVGHLQMCRGIRTRPSILFGFWFILCELPWVQVSWFFRSSCGEVLTVFCHSTPFLLTGLSGWASVGKDVFSPAGTGYSRVVHQ